MKKMLSTAVSLLLTASLTLALCAVPSSRVETPSAAGTNMPEADYHIVKAETAPTIDGAFDGEDTWGSPIIDVTGEDAYWYTVEQEKFRAKYPSWAKTGLNLWEKTDGSVEFMRNIRVRVYSRWDEGSAAFSDVPRLYFAFVIEGNIHHDDDGNPVFYDNYDKKWFANNAEITLGPEDPELNYSDRASDADFDNQYVPGYVGNEYLFAITDSVNGLSAGVINQGQYADKKAPSPMRIGRGSEIVAKNDPSVETGLQVYEMALPFEFVFCSVEQGKTVGIPFTCAVNVQYGDAYAAESLQGFQMGLGLFYRDFPQIFNSTRLFLEDDVWACPGHTGGEHLRNCVVKAKCTLCDARYGEYGEHTYENGKCVYCEACQHVFGAYTPDSDPTCTEAGTKTATCEKCGASDTVADESRPALNHSFTDYTYNNDATCTESGTKTAKCDRCDATETVDDPEHPATGHRFGEDGKCESCGATSERQILVGDLDGSGEINAKDATLLKRYLAGWDISAQVKDHDVKLVKISGDSDQNGEITAKDSTLMSRYLAKWTVDSSINIFVPYEAE